MKTTVLCEGERCIRSPVTRKYNLVPCTKPATTTRKNKHVLNGPKLYNFCATCAEIHDEYENELEGEARCS
jgi:hypothetical protein